MLYGLKLFYFVLNFFIYLTQQNKLLTNIKKMTTTEKLHYTKLESSHFTNIDYHLQKEDTYSVSGGFYVNYLLHTITDEGAMCGRFKNTYKVTAKVGGINDYAPTTSSLYLFATNAIVDLDNTNMATLTEDAVIDLFDEILG